MTDELKLQGTAREAENSHAITAIFNRSPTNDEMRAIHEAIAAWNTCAEPSVQEAALIEWSAARKGATLASPEAWERLARAEGALQLLADAALRAIAEKGGK